MRHSQNSPTANLHAALKCIFIEYANELRAAYAAGLQLVLQFDRNGGLARTDIKALIPNSEEIDRAVTAREMAHALGCFDGDYGFFLNEREAAFLSDLEKSPKLLTKSEWEWLLEIHKRYCDAEAAAAKSVAPGDDEVPLEL